LGRADHARALLAKYRIPDSSMDVAARQLKAAIAYDLGDYAAAADLFAEAAPLLDTKDPWARAWEWIFPGDLAADEGQYERAAELYRTALQHYQRVSFRAGVYWVTQRLGILAIRMGDQCRGVRILATPCESGATMLRGNVPELAYERRRAMEQARVLLGDEAFAAEGSVGQAFTLEEAALEALKDTTVEQVVSTSDGPLTRRQQEVAVLIARGMTNRQIAEHLVVSPHTVERHVENILDKLRLSSRIEIAVWMVRHERG